MLPHRAPSPRNVAEHTPSIDMDRVLACFATTAEDVAAMVCGSFSHMVPQASERWQRPAVKALVRTIHQELCDPELLGRLAPVCKELGTAAVDEATRMLAGIGLPVEAVMPEERVLTDRSHKPYPPQKRPPGLFPRLACLRVLEGLRVRCEVNELAERLRSMGAVVVTEDQQRAHVARFERLRKVGATLGNCHEDTCTHAHAVANDSSEDLDLVVQGHEATPLRDDDDRLVGPVGVSVDMLRFFVLDPWVSEERTVASGADLSDDEVRELVNGGQGDWDADHVRAWATEGSQGGLPNWQDLTLRVHTHVRSGDRVYECADRVCSPSRIDDVSRGDGVDASSRAGGTTASEIMTTGPTTTHRKSCRGRRASTSARTATGTATASRPTGPTSATKLP